MYKNELLEKPYDVMNDIILLLSNTEEAMDKAELACKTGKSPNTLNGYIQLINAFIHKNHFVKELKIVEKDEKIYLVKAPGFSLHQLTNLFLQYSIKVRILITLFEQGEINGEIFQVKYNISSSTYYRRIRELNKFLAEFDLKINRCHLIGSRRQIRYFFFTLFWLLIEDKSELEKISMNQYETLIRKLSTELKIDFEPSEILQIKLWMMISSKKISRPVLKRRQSIRGQEDPDRPCFLQVNQVFYNYMRQNEQNYSLDEARAFYDFFVSQRNFSPTADFSQKLLEESKNHHTYLSRINRQIMELLFDFLHITREVSPEKKAYAERLFYFFHASLYYFKGVIIDSEAVYVNDWFKISNYSKFHGELLLLNEFYHHTFGKYKQSRTFSSSWLEQNYAFVLNQLMHFENKKVVIAVKNTMNPYYQEMTIQNVLQALEPRYPVQVVNYAGQQCDILLSNISTKPLAKNTLQYVYTDCCNKYDLSQICALVDKYLKESANHGQSCLQSESFLLH